MSAPMSVRARSGKCFLAFLMALMISSLPHVVFAETLSNHARGTAEQMISTVEVVESLTRSEAEAKIRGYLDREDLQKEMVKVGLNPQEVSKRLATLSTVELNQLAKQMDQARYGGEIVGILVVALVVILIIFFAKRI